MNAAVRLRILRGLLRRSAMSIWYIFAVIPAAAHQFECEFEGHLCHQVSELRGAKDAG